MHNVLPQIARQFGKPAAQHDLRIALISGNYNYVRDGANQALNRLVGFLERKGVAVRVYSPTSDTPAFEPQGTLVSVPSVRMPGRGEYRVGLGLTAALKRDMRDFNPTLVHLSAPDLLGHRAKAFARTLGVPIVASVHTRFETYFRYYGAAWFQRTAEGMLRKFYGDLAEIYAPSESMADVLREQQMSERIAIWSRGVDRGLFRPSRRDIDWRRAQGIADDEAVVGFVGRLVLEKGLDVVADTIAELEARGVKHRVVVVGEGPARDWISERLPNAIYTGHQSGEALARAYASMDMLFNPSTTETFGNVTLEAMASALPVVAAVSTGSSSLVSDGRSGRLVAPSDIAGFADALAGYAADADARRAAGAQGLMLSARYDWDEINQGMLDHYRGVLATAAPAEPRRFIAANRGFALPGDTPRMASGQL
jgi:phosphatidylinositol alpha 1,6-mannosyltransferase